MLDKDIPEALMLEAGVLGKPDDGRASYDRFRGRVMFPIQDATGRLVGFGGRLLPRLERDADGNPARVGKYVNSPETPLFRKSRLLYGLDRVASHRESFDAVGDGGRWGILVEGYTDVIACHEAGLPHAFAALGTAFTAEHVTLLRRYFDGLVAAYRERRDVLVAGLRAVGFEVFVPAGTYFVLADHTKFGFPDDVAFARHLVTEVGVAVIPPSAFYHRAGDGASLIRFAFCKDVATLERAVDRLGALRA